VICLLRIAGILLDEEKYDEALRAISVPHGDSFGLYLDVKVIFGCNP
jgi:predicted negative regulator of RcsB-dependent stress response